MAVYLRFQLAGEVYAIPVANLIEVAALGELAAVPGARAEFLGVLNLRGLILPVVDLAAVLQLERSAPPNRLLVAAVDDLRVGFAVDDVTGIAELAGPTEEVESRLLLGAVLADGSLVGVLDVPRVLEFVATPADLAANAYSMRAVPP